MAHLELSQVSNIDALPEAKAKSLTKSQRAATAKKKLKNPSKIVSNTKKSRVKR